MMRENGKDNARGNANGRQNSVVTSRFILAHGWFITMRIVTTARRLGPLICTYFLSFAAAEPTEKKKKKKRVEERKRNGRVVSGVWIIQPAALVCRVVDNDNRGSPGNDNCSSISFVGRITIIATLITRWWSNTVWLIRKTSLAIRINCNVEERIHRMYPWRLIFISPNSRNPRKRCLDVDPRTSSTCIGTWNRQSPSTVANFNYSVS